MMSEPPGDPAARALREAQELLDEQPSGAVRARVLAAAALRGAAVRRIAPPARPGVTLWSGRFWLAGASVTVMVVLLTIGLTWHLQQDHRIELAENKAPAGTGGTAVPAPMPVPAPVPAPLSASIPRPSPLFGDAATKSTIASPSAKTAVSPAPVQQSPTARMQQPLSPPPVAPIPAPASPVASNVPVPSEQIASVQSDQPPSAATAQQLAQADAFAPAPSPAPAPARELPLVREESGASVRSRMAMTPPPSVGSAPAYRKSPKEWLEHIRSLRKEQQEIQVQDELRLFHTAFPREEIPPDLANPAP